MKGIGLIFALLAVASNALAAPAMTPAATDKLSRAAQQGYDVGFRDCAAAVDNLVKFIHEDDQNYAYFGQWSATDPNRETFSSLTSEVYNDGKGLTAFAATKNAAGKCSVVVTQTVVIPNTICATLRETTFKTWKEYAELNGDKILEDPTTPNANVVLTPIGQTGCLLLKHIVSYGLDPTPAKK